MIISAVVSMPQVKSGTRTIVIPGARNDMMVTMKLMAAAMLEMPVRMMPAIHRSMPAPGAMRLNGA